MPILRGSLKAVADLDNRHVEAGRLLAVIEPSGPEAQLTEAEAGVQQAIAQAEQAKAQVLAARAAPDRATSTAPAPVASAQKARHALKPHHALQHLHPPPVPAHRKS